ncbi:Signal transduction histidine kinase [Microbispora rosea]|uniref:histidine kinase n=1 Tax=Microbispora rosea TaxID=58117 RepID=A0A1N7FLC4_9ACTN|nr:Signal transduction histidine kinase [Microbispora rosea]
MSLSSLKSRLQSRLKSRLRGLPPPVVDAVLVLAVLAGQSAPFLFTQPAPGRPPWTVAEYLPVLGASIPLLWRRRMPVTCHLVVAVSMGWYALYDPIQPAQPIWFGSLVAMYTVAEKSPPVRRYLAAAFVGLGFLIQTGLATTARGVVLWAGAYAVGRAAAMRKAYSAALEARAVQLERQKEIEAERAAERERARIARDMHDILAHAVSLMVVQAEAGPVVVRGDPERAEKTFDAIAAAGRDAMAQLRRMLGVLKETEASRGPQPTLARVPELVAAVSATGPRTTLTVRGRPRPVPPDLDVAAYRVVQESLTNIVKHARAASATVAVDWEDDALVITVIDDGRGPGTPSPAAGGNGLIGIRERAAACGGRAAFGPGPDGAGFRVTVRLPLVETAVAR